MKPKRNYDSEAWKAQRKRVRARSGGICERCKTNTARHVHHFYYPDGPLGTEPLSWLQHVCYVCHGLYHNNRYFGPPKPPKPQKRKRRPKRPREPILRPQAKVPMKRLGYLPHNEATDWMFYSQLRSQK